MQVLFEKGYEVKEIKGLGFLQGDIRYMQRLRKSHIWDGISYILLIPVIASGGCGCIQDIVEVFQKTNGDAALVASLFHFGEATVEEVKEELWKQDIRVRTIDNETRF